MVGEAPWSHLVFTPTSSSWLNLVERWFRELTGNRLRRGVFKSVGVLIAAIEEYIATHNAQPRPFVWTKSVAAILEKIERRKAILETVHWQVHGRVPNSQNALGDLPGLPT